MASINWGAIAPQTASGISAQLLAAAEAQPIMKQFSAIKDDTNVLYTSYWDDDDPEVEDALYTCVGRCGSYVPCCLRELHTAEDGDANRCAMYDACPLDGMVGEVLGKQETIKFRRFGYETFEQESLVQVTTEGPYTYTETNGVVQGQEEV